jgi:hypothetical protein
MVVNSRYQGRNSKPRYTLIILTDLPSLREDREMGMSQAGGDVRAATYGEEKFVTIMLHCGGATW